MLNSLIILYLTVAAVATPAAGVGRSAADSVPLSYVPQRVYDTHHKRFIDFESMLADATGADVLFLGEQHDDPATHRLETRSEEHKSEIQSPQNIVFRL